MKITAMTTMMLMASAAVYGQSTARDHQITVCMEGDGQGEVAIIQPARLLASKMFAAIRVSINWERGFRDCPADGILVSLDWKAPATLDPDALGYALPYQGTHVFVYYDRIAGSGQQFMASVVLADVLVHEITHILQGESRHSDRGIMKARWNARDFFQMTRKPLEFTPEDIDLIYIGLAARAHRSMLAMNANRRAGSITH